MLATKSTQLLCLQCNKVQQWPDLFGQLKLLLQNKGAQIALDSHFLGKIELSSNKILQPYLFVGSAFKVIGVRKGNM